MNPIIRMLVVIIVVAAGIRLVYELLKPVIPLLIAGVVVFTVIQLARWYRERL
jgi:predicted PurR-regulated permease PerM